MNSSSEIPDVPLAEDHVRFFHMTNNKRHAFDIHARGLNFEHYPSLLFKAFGPFKTADEAKHAHAAHRNSEGVWRDAWILYFDVPEGKAEQFSSSDRERPSWVDKEVYHQYCTAVFTGKSDVQPMDTIITGTTKFGVGYYGKL